MGIFDRFPYSSTHEMNLDFMLGKATEIAEDMQTVATGMAQVHAGLSAISEKTEQATQAAAQAAQSASSIEGSVTAAEEAAEEAQMHNESAQTWANNAMTYKADCQRSATEAAASSSSAAQAATAAAASEDTVAQYAQAANASAQSAANNNDSAHQYANQASASASNATFHSSNAQTAATNAQTAATNANTSATNASASADRAASLKSDVETLHRMCVAAVDQAANSAVQAAASKTDVENLVESLPEDFTDLNNTVNQLSDEIDTLLPIGIGFNKTTYSHSETTTVGSHTFMFPATIPAGTTIKITNTTANTSQTNNLQKAGGGEVGVGNLSGGQSMTLTLEFDCTGIRNYINTTEWGVSVEFGGEIKTQIDQNTSDIATIKAHNSANDTLAIGTLSNGVYDSASTKRITDLDYIPVVKGCIVNARISFGYTAYDSNKVFVGTSSWQPANNPLVINDDYSFIRVVIRVNDTYEFTDADLITYADAITITYPVNDIVLNLLENSYGESELPSYYDTQLNTVLPNIKQEMFDAGISGESFMFFSDPHWEGNRKRSPFICKTVIKNTQISKIVCGGDLINQSANKTTMIDTMLDLVDSFKDISPFYVALGNHDTNDAQNNSPNQRFTKSEAYSLCQKQTDQIMTYGEPCYYYFDNPTTKTRFIVLDTGLETMTTDATQIAWLKSVLADAEADWHIIVFAHITYNGYPNQTITTFFSTVAGILDTNNADNSKAKVEAVFSGHLHADANYTTTGGIPIVLIDCDGSATNSASGAPAGTINENCVDAVVINYTTETIYCNRIGRGSSRTITY